MLATEEATLYELDIDDVKIISSLLDALMEADFENQRIYKESNEN